MNSKAMVPAETSLGNHSDISLRAFTWNEDVLMEILLWLPAKSIIRFKLVCKRWLLLFSSDVFRHLHTLRCPKLQRSLILETSTSLFFYFNPITDGDQRSMIPYNFPNPDPRIRVSCNGLMLLQSHFRDKSFYVYNPTTRQSREIILPDTLSGDESVTEALALAFDPSKSPHYQVVSIRLLATSVAEAGKTYNYQIDAYDSESRTWKLSLGPITLLEELWILQGAYLNGLIYWRMPSQYCSYDIARNEFKTFSRPSLPLNEDGFLFCHVQESNGNLYQYKLSKEGECQSIMLFELDTDDRSSWLLKYHDVISQSIRDAQPLIFTKGSDDTETSSLVYHVSGKINRYSFLDKRIKELVDFTGELFYEEEFGMKGYEFGECLAVV